ncbi:spore cortex biosynthesis protein YabQ [Bacillus sp. E214]|jgi:spore cortex biosynthesis protein YabQ|uniref:spore cortex biosynthesis protein YabQ n=1 Tax=Bacillus sp. E214 TaxID=2587156 RepID=UPI0011DFFA0D|nr:spore cortex biosynthesis protein YabQ [Bacillus sp. E214]
MSLDTQFVTLLSMIGMGIYFGAAFDTYNRFLVRAKRKVWFVFINDILFWCIQALLIFYVLYESNQGEWRFYILLALLCGYSAYQALLRNSYKRLLEMTIYWVNKFSKFLVKLGALLFIRPIKGLIALIITVILLIFQVLLKFGNPLLWLAKYLLKALISIVRVIFYPFTSTASWLWKTIPGGVRSPVEKFFDKLAGIGKKLKNTINKLLKKWTNKS